MSDHAPYPLATDSPATLAHSHWFCEIEEELMVIYDLLFIHRRFFWGIYCCPGTYFWRVFAPDRERTWAEMERLDAEQVSKTEEMHQTSDAYMASSKADCMLQTSFVSSN
jgi:hypothetical protein